MTVEIFENTDKPGLAVIKCLDGFIDILKSKKEINLKTKSGETTLVISEDKSDKPILFIVKCGTIKQRPNVFWTCPSLVLERDHFSSGRKRDCSLGSVDDMLEIGFEVIKANGNSLTKYVCVLVEEWPEIDLDAGFYEWTFKDPERLKHKDETENTTLEEWKKFDNNGQYIPARVFAKYINNCFLHEKDRMKLVHLLYKVEPESNLRVQKYLYNIPDFEKAVKDAKDSFKKTLNDLIKK